MAISGNKTLSSTLRALTSAELYLNASFYASHPHFLPLLATEETPGLIGRFFQLSHTFEVTDLMNPAECNYSQLVQLEALKNCQAKRWSPFVCLMALASVTGIDIHSLYPKTGSIGSGRYAIKLFNAIIKPQSNTESSYSHIHLLRSHYAGSSNDINPSFQSNRIVPVFYFYIFQPHVNKIICFQEGKKVPSSSTECKTTKMAMFPPLLMSSNLKQSKICFPVATQPKSLSDRKSNLQVSLCLMKSLRQLCKVLLQTLMTLVTFVTK